jgi:Pyruvate/2-oxoacid:ferredoxin oxidoreductase delta subunit
LSGTGNSYRAACWLAEDARERGIGAETVAIGQAEPIPAEEFGPELLCAFYFPTHGFMPPWSMIKFLLQLQRGRGTRAAVVATRGAIKVGRVVIPGAAGMAVFMATLILALKGYRVRGGLGLDMPANMLNVHWGMQRKNALAIIERGKARHAQFSSALHTGGSFWSPRNILWEAAWSAGILLWYPVFPIAYLLVGRVFMAKVNFADDSCKGCGKCSSGCPNEAIVMVGKGKTRRPFWTRHCEVCMRCVAYCDFHAVQSSWAWGVLLLYLLSFVSAGFVQHALQVSIGLDLPLHNLAGEVAAMALMYLGIITLYSLFWGLTHLRPVRWLLSALNPTRYYRRYHEPDTSRRDLMRNG